MQQQQSTWMTRGGAYWRSGGQSVRPEEETTPPLLQPPSSTGSRRPRCGTVLHRACMTRGEAFAGLAAARGVPATAHPRPRAHSGRNQAEAAAGRVGSRGGCEAWRDMLLHSAVTPGCSPPRSSSLHMVASGVLMVCVCNKPTLKARLVHDRLLYKAPRRRMIPQNRMNPARAVFLACSEPS